MKQKALKESELAQVIFASYGMASEGLDIPDLNTLFMVTSRRSVEQAVGRIIRKIDPDVRPLIYDFTDMLPSFARQGLVRRKLYKKMGFEISITTVKNNEIIAEENLENMNELKKVVKVENDDCEFI